MLPIWKVFFFVRTLELQKADLEHQKKLWSGLLMIFKILVWLFTLCLCYILYCELDTYCSLLRPVVSQVNRDYRDGNFFLTEMLDIKFLLFISLINRTWALQSQVAKRLYFSLSQKIRTLFVSWYIWTVFFFFFFKLRPVLIKIFFFEYSLADKFLS